MAAAASIWLDLLPEILQLILEKVAVSEDDIKSCRAVCRVWRKAAESFISLPFPWLLVLPKNLYINGIEQGQSFYSIEEGKKTYELRNMSDYYMRSWVVAVGSSFGWLVVYQLTLCGRTIYRLLTLFDPCSRRKLVLPSVENLILPSDCYSDDVLLSTKAILLSNPSRTKSWRVVAISSTMSTSLALYIHGNPTWIEFGHRSRYEDILWHNDKLYALIFGGTVDVWEFVNGNISMVPTKVASFALNTRDHIENLYPPAGIWRKICQLVRSMDDVLLVVQAIVVDNVRSDDHEPIQHFDVYRLDCIGKKWEKLESLGDRTLFLTTDRTSISVNYNNYSCDRKYCSTFQKNSIYFLSAAWTPAGSIPKQTLYAGVYSFEKRLAKRQTWIPTVTFFIGRTSTWIHPIIMKPKPKPKPECESESCNKFPAFLFFIPILHLALLWLHGRRPKLF